MADRNIDFCPCGRPSIGFLQGINCCAKCEKLERGYWNRAAATTSKLHGVSMLDVDIAQRANAIQKILRFHDSDEDAAAGRENRVQFHLGRILDRQQFQTLEKVA